MKKIRNKNNICLNEILMLEELLIIQKELINTYNYVLIEISNDYLCENVKKIYDDTLNCIRKIYNLIFYKGYVSISIVEDYKIENLLKKYNNKLDELI